MQLMRWDPFRELGEVGTVEEPVERVGQKKAKEQERKAKEIDVAWLTDYKPKAK
jgi:hypothetical protein